MIDLHLKPELAQEAASLGWEHCGELGWEEVTPKSSRSLRDKVRNSKADYTILLTSDAQMARQSKADILALDFGDLVFDTVIAEKSKYVEFDLHSIIFSDKQRRAVANFEKALLLARKCRNKILVSMRAGDKYELRAPRDVRAFLKVLGMTDEEAKRAVADNPKQLFEKLAKRKDPNYIMEGIEIEEAPGSEG